MLWRMLDWKTSITGTLVNRYSSRESSLVKIIESGTRFEPERVSLLEKL